MAGDAIYQKSLITRQSALKQYTVGYPSDSLSLVFVVNVLFVRYNVTVSLNAVLLLLCNLLWIYLHIFENLMRHAWQSGLRPSSGQKAWNSQSWSICKASWRDGRPHVLSQRVQQYVFSCRLFHIPLVEAYDDFYSEQCLRLTMMGGGIWLFSVLVTLDWRCQVFFTTSVATRVD